MAKIVDDDTMIEDCRGVKDCWVEDTRSLKGTGTGLSQ